MRATHDLHNYATRLTFIFISPRFCSQACLMIETETYVSQRERSPRRRSRSPRSSRRRSYSPRSRSRSREDRHRRSRSPIINNSSGMSAGGAPHRSFEERAQAREQMLSSLRESSQQDRRSVLHFRPILSMCSQTSKGLRWQS